MRSGSTEWMRKGSMIVRNFCVTARPMLVRSALPDASKRIREPARPSLAVTWKHEAGLHTVEPGEGLEGPRQIGPKRGELGTGLARQDVVRRERIADEKRVVGRDVQRRAPFAVSGKVDHAGRAGDVEGRAVAERGDLRDRGRSQHAVAERESYEAEQRTDPDARPRLVLRLLLAARHPGVELVDADPTSALTADTLGEPDVIGVGVRQYDRSHVGQRAPHRRKLAGQIVPVRGSAAVDDRDLAAFFEKIGIDEAIADAMDAGRELHWRAAGRRVVFVSALRLGSAAAAIAS